VCHEPVQVTLPFVVNRQVVVPKEHMEHLIWESLVSKKAAWKHHMHELTVVSEKRVQVMRVHVAPCPVGFQHYSKMILQIIGAEDGVLSSCFTNSQPPLNIMLFKKEAALTNS
jgi:hypothetical protein